MQAPLVTPTFLLFPSTHLRAGALVWINLLLSAEAQSRQSVTIVWGSYRCDVMRLSEEDRVLFESVDLGPATLTSDALACPFRNPRKLG